MKSYLEKIAEYRRQIDEIDQHLLRLLKQRFDLAAEIGRIKAHYQTDIKDDRRESDLISGVEKFCDDHHLNKEFAVNIWRQILSQSHFIQNSVKNGS